MAIDERLPVHVVGRDSGVFGFRDFGEAAIHVTENTDYWQVELPLEAGYDVKLFGSRWDDEPQRVVISDGRSAISTQRGNSDNPGISLQADPHTNIVKNIILNLENRDSDFFDRGLAWINVLDTRQARLIIGIRRNHQATSEEAKEKLTFALHRAGQFMTSIFNKSE